jgi:hypothetical protein
MSLVGTKEAADGSRGKNVFVILRLHLLHRLFPPADRGFEIRPSPPASLLRTSRGDRRPSGE